MPAEKAQDKRVEELALCMYIRDMSVFEVKYFKWPSADSGAGIVD
jgi:hypothetical protein